MMQKMWKLIHNLCIFMSFQQEPVTSAILLLSPVWTMYANHQPVCLMDSVHLDQAVIL